MVNPNETTPPSKSFKIYLAGPEVFLPNAIDTSAAKSAICQHYGLTPLSPVDNEVKGIDDPQDMAYAIFQGNLDMMRSADGIIANITSFRGPHMDPGTAFEIGFFKALGKPIVLYSQDAEELSERVKQWSVEHHPDPHGTRDKNGHLIESFGLAENLMIDMSTSLSDLDAKVLITPTNKKIECVRGFHEAVKIMHQLVTGEPGNRKNAMTRFLNSTSLNVKSKAPNHFNRACCFAFQAFNALA